MKGSPGFRANSKPTVKSVFLNISAFILMWCLRLEMTVEGYYGRKNVNVAGEKLRIRSRM